MPVPDDGLASANHVRKQLDALWTNVKTLPPNQATDNYLLHTVTQMKVRSPGTAKHTVSGYPTSAHLLTGYCAVAIQVHAVLGLKIRRIRVD